MKKILFWGGLGLALLVAGFIAVTIMSINPIVEKAVNTFGPDLLGAPVHLDESDISVFSGEGALRGLLVGNPPGFKSDEALRLGSVSVKVDKSSLASDRIVINDVTVIAPKITYELSGSTSNIQALADNVTKLADRQEAAQESRKAAGKDEAGSKQTIRIDTLLIKDGEITLAVSGLGGKVMTVPLPEIRMTGIGKEGNGASMAEAFAEIMAEIEKAVAGSASAALGELGKGIKQGAEQLKQGADEIKKNVEGLGEGLKKMFK